MYWASNEKSNAQWKAAELERLHDAMWEKLKTASYPEKILVLTLIPNKWSQKYISKHRELNKVGGILAKPVPKKVKHFHKKLLI